MIRTEFWFCFALVQKEKWQPKYAFSLKIIDEFAKIIKQLTLLSVCCSKNGTRGIMHCVPALHTECVWTVSLALFLD